jgi:hypothetical protein
MLTTIEETYRIVDKKDSSIERGLLEISTTLTPGAPLFAHAVRVVSLSNEGLPSGDYKLDFVKRLNSPDLYRRPRRSFRDVAGPNDPRPFP